jgi:hypothetical protein
VKNANLPQKCHKGGIWWKQMISTLIQWAASQPNSWSIPDILLVQALQIICNIFYGDTIDLEVSASSAAFHIVSIIYLTTTLMRDNSHFLGHIMA